MPRRSTGTPPRRGSTRLELGGPAPTTLTFVATIELVGVNPFVRISRARAQRLRRGWRRPMPVRFRLVDRPGGPWSTNLMPVGEGAFYLYLNGGARGPTKTAVGDVVRLSVAFDAVYRPGPADPMPPEFRRGLRAESAAAATSAALPPSRKKEVLRYLARLKSTDVRARNVGRALRVLRGAPERFLGRTWEVDVARGRGAVRRPLRGSQPA